MSPHGVFQVPKSAVSLSEAAASDCSSCSAGALPMSSTAPAPPPPRAATSSPQNTASDVGIGVHCPAQVPLAQQGDLLGHFRLQRIGGRRLVPGLDQRRDGLLEPREVAVERRRDQRVEREILPVLEDPDGVQAARRFAAGLDISADSLPSSGCSARPPTTASCWCCRASRSRGSAGAASRPPKAVPATRSPDCCHPPAWSSRSWYRAGE